MRLPPPEAEPEGPNLTPVIDVVFLLLIFFLVATRFNEEEKLASIRLPDILQARPMTMGPDEVIVNVTKEGKFVVGDETFTKLRLEALLHQLAIKNPKTQTVQIRGDRDVPYEYPMTVVGICQKEKIRSVCTVIETRRR